MAVAHLPVGNDFYPKKAEGDEAAARAPPEVAESSAKAAPIFFFIVAEKKSQIVDFLASWIQAYEVMGGRKEIRGQQGRMRGRGIQNRIGKEGRWEFYFAVRNG